MRKSIGLVWLMLAGCGPTVTVDDDVDIVWDWKALTGPSSQMHTPYVLGASMNLYVDTTDDDEQVHVLTLGVVGIPSAGVPELPEVEAYRTLAARGARFLTPPVESEWEVRAFFRDPDGHLIEISEARSAG